MGDAAFVPADFAVPSGLVVDAFVLEPLGPQHNIADFAAWSTSIEHIRATPGFIGRTWPREMPIEANLADLESHARDFEARTGFTYTVLDPSGTVIGCLYIYPDRTERSDASVRSWVRAENAPLDRSLWQAVSAWLAEEWPFTRIDYAPRPDVRSPTE